MPVSEEHRVTPITEASLEKMPKRMARRLMPALKPELEDEFLECIEDLGYTSHLASTMMRQIMFELFVGGWGAKTRQLKRKKKAKDK